MVLIYTGRRAFANAHGADAYTDDRMITAARTDVNGLERTRTDAVKE